MRILRVIRSASRESGGPIEGIIQSGRILVDLGHQVEVLSLDSTDAPWRGDFPLPFHPVGRRSEGYGYSPDFVPWLLRHGPSYDAVVVSGLWQYPGIGTRQAARRGGFGYWVFPHGMLDPWFKHHYPLKHLKKWLYWPWAEYRVLRDARAVLFTTEEERILARKSFWLYRCNERVVSYGTAAPESAEDRQTTAFRQRLPEMTGKRFLLFLSRIHEKKGCDLLIKAFAAECGRQTGLDLVIAGPDQTGMKATLHQMATQLGVADRIHWPGMLQGDAKWGAFRACEAFVLPSHQENFGIAVAEALAAGRPVLTTNKVNIWREIVADDAGFIADDTVAGTIDLLRRWNAASSEQKLRLGNNAKKSFQSRFEIHKVATDLINVLQTDAPSPRL